jgi:5-methylcytosine-specific restriction endonuclease McrA
VSVPANAFPALVLNADFRPLSYFPLSIWAWQDAVKAVFLDRVNIVSEYDQAIHSPSFEIKLPSVISLKEYVPLNRRPAFTRFNVFLRDGFRCQYSGIRLPAEQLTFDHVIPRSRGGRTSWENVVTASAEMNLLKANKTPDEAGMKLRRAARQPTVHELQRQARKFPPNYLHESWHDFLYWDTELED